MSRLTDLLAQVKAKDNQLGKDLEREFKTLASRRSFGLNFERHRPEAVELPQRPVRRGDKVRVLPERGSTKKGDQRLWSVKSIDTSGEKPMALLSLLQGEDEYQKVEIDDLVFVAEFQDYIYPGLVSTGKVKRGGNKPHHTVINGENYHALKALTYTHRGKIDAIYIDPPYNTGAKDWKYNNNYVEEEDLYRHSKWLAMMERRLVIARQLLNPSRSVLILTIDEKEVHRIGLLLQDLFPEARIQMVTIVINRKGSTRGQELARVDEYAFLVYLGDIKASPTRRELLENAISSKSGKTPQIWYPLIRSGTDVTREHSKNGFYPIYIDKPGGKIIEVGKPLLPVTKSRDSVKARPGLIAVWPTLADGSDGRWQVSHEKLPKLVEAGMVRAGRVNSRTKQVSITYLKAGEIKRLKSGEIVSSGKDENGVLQLEYADLDARERVGKTVWNNTSHEAGEHGTKLLRRFLPDRKFPFPKSLYAVEDALRFFILDNKDAIVLDFFCGSGTTAHAVMRLNAQDGGKRQSIMVTNNEVSSSEHTTLLRRGFRPGDPDWEELGICEFITKPRVKAAILGETSTDIPVKGNYKSIDESAMSDGFEENAEFFNLTYETPIAINHNLAFERVAPLLWMRAGSIGDRIDTIPDCGWAIVHAYGLLVDLDKAAAFCEAVSSADGIAIAYIVTNNDRRFQAVARQLPDSVEPVRLYESYLTNFRFTSGG